ncbi:MAG: UDP-N-acetylmuramoyl-L-alanyl-D-glutamate--2,6-diaminopimelate ligase [Bdellovibrionales bacterium]|nr:UDP-N-acetylmuramoyl-L-alanyl-D-glutamate--2,6-diaminopimelate ligase [Bdellovibrionales bacterium]
MIHVTANSKEVKPGSVFFALKGAKFDGHQFIREALDKGASQVYSEEPFADTRVKCVGKSARKKLGEFAAEMYGNPTRQLKMIGVTGTSGKTTTTYLIQHLLNASGARCARLGTNGAEFEGKQMDTLNTTPDALSLQKWFREVLDAGASHVVMEVSSHSLDQDRVWGIVWDAAVFLNLSHEHLDYHPTFDEYFAAKERLFTDHAAYSRSLNKTPVLLTRLDHEYGAKLLKHVGVMSYSVKDSIRGQTINISGTFHLFYCPLYGSFQNENILAAVNVVSHLGIPAEKIIVALRSFPGVPGRMEQVHNNRDILVFVDYAHKPEALEKVLQSIQGKRITTVFGCGGDRDKSKRPLMGAIAARLSDRVIITSDNPRTENPEQILREVEAGLVECIRNGQARITPTCYQVIEDRRVAIQTAILAAGKGEIVLIAGKGHEDYQIIGTTKRHFDDREEARNALR